MTDIFLSYAREDRDRAERLAKAMESHGWSVWWDRRIQAGQSFAQAIERQLEAARCVVVLWTRSSVNSKWVQNEATEGDQRTTLIPIRLDDVKIPLGFRHLQTADLLGWTGEPSAALADCLAAVEGMIGPPRTAAPVPAEVAPPPAPQPHLASAPAALAPPLSHRTAMVFLIVLVVMVIVALLIGRSCASDRTTAETASTTGATGTTTTMTVTTTAETTTTQEMEPEPAASATPVPKTPLHPRPAAPGPAISTPTSTANNRHWVDIETAAGIITIECFDDLTPNHANHFMFFIPFRMLMEEWVFAVVRPGMYIQAGVVSRGKKMKLASTIAPEYRPDAFSPRGLVAFSRASDTDPAEIYDSFFIYLGNSWPSRKYTYFGRVVKGLDVADQIATGAADEKHHALQSVRIIRMNLRNR